MAIFQRIGDILKANINDLLDKAENPEKMVKQIIIDMEKELEKCTNALGQAMGSQRQLGKQLNSFPLSFALDRSQGQSTHSGHDSED